MFNSTLKLYSTMLAVTAAPRRSEKGQGTLEYIGIVIIAGLLVTAIVTGVKATHIDTTITNKIQDIIDTK